MERASFTRAMRCSSCSISTCPIRPASTFCKRVKENNHLKATPVVVLTTTDDSHEIKRCYELGCNVYITKPVNYESFANAIRQLGLFFSVIQVPPAAT